LRLEKGILPLRRFGLRHTLGNKKQGEESGCHFSARRTAPTIECNAECEI
jgi:hypothetical protein